MMASMPLLRVTFCSRQVLPCPDSVAGGRVTLAATSTAGTSGRKYVRQVPEHESPNPEGYR
jgi:hypothetical protein